MTEDIDLTPGNTGLADDRVAPRPTAPLVLTLWSNRQHFWVLASLFAIGFVMFGMALGIADFKAHPALTTSETLMRGIKYGAFGGVLCASVVYVLVAWVWVCQTMAYKLVDMKLLPTALGRPKA